MTIQEHGQDHDGSSTLRRRWKQACPYLKPLAPFRLFGNRLENAFGLGVSSAMRYGVLQSTLPYLTFPNPAFQNVSVARDPITKTKTPHHASTPARSHSGSACLVIDTRQRREAGARCSLLTPPGSNTASLLLWAVYASTQYFLVPWLAFHSTRRTLMDVGALGDVRHCQVSAE